MSNFFDNIGVGITNKSMVDKWLRTVLPSWMPTNYVDQEIINDEIYLDWQALYSTMLNSLNILKDCPSYIKFYNQDINLSDSYGLGAKILCYIATNQLASAAKNNNGRLFNKANLNKEVILNIMPTFFDVFPNVNCITLDNYLGICIVKIID